MIWIIFVILIFSKADNQEQIHIAQGLVPGEIIFTWNTRTTTQTTYVRIAAGSIWEYYSGKTRDFKDTSNIWVIHTVSVKLKPGRHYHYQVGCKIDGFSTSYSLNVPVDSEPANFLLLGDLATNVIGGAATWDDIEKISKDLSIQTLIHVGDLAYDLCSNQSTTGDNYMKTLQPIVHTIPYMVCAGNREATDNYYNYNKRFDMPGNNFYYTFTVGYVRFLAIHTEAFFTETDMLNPMMDFIRKVLGRSTDDIDSYPWLIVYGHRPMHCISTGTNNPCTEATTILTHLEPLFHQFHVDLYINGHVHNYQRTAPIYQGLSIDLNPSNVYYNPEATVYITTGGAGSNNDNAKVTIVDAPEWLVAVDEDLSFSTMTVYNQTHLYWKQLNSKDNSVPDEFWLIKASN